MQPSTLSWVNRYLNPGERVVRTEALRGGTAAEVRKLTTLVSLTA
ncbi:hypothetical protein [Rhodococcoides kyotonense]|uniref:Uncharacterized protein n=1 Tax=Rhodococcoides kyotonense TaxID=398843 RepID=A0A239KTJ9_9NOCA|nr:hypothetical protein [Rhodococcus kyotonensis]SNT21676.1 hypothetical protein SAMN05421642_111101 [Rhodococcus kyotonensis]